MSRKRGNGNEPEKLTFEQALERIEEIVARMEEGSLGLDEMMARFEEGRALLRFCRERLNEVEKKVELLLEKEGELTTEPFSPPPTGNESSEGGKAEV